MRNDVKQQNALNAQVAVIHEADPSQATAARMNTRISSAVTSGPARTIANNVPGLALWALHKQSPGERHAAHRQRTPADRQALEYQLEPRRRSADLHRHRPGTNPECNRGVPELVRERRERHDDEGGDQEADEPAGRADRDRVHASNIGDPPANLNCGPGAACGGIESPRVSVRGLERAIRARMTTGGRHDAPARNRDPQ